MYTARSLGGTEVGFEGSRAQESGLGARQGTICYLLSRDYIYILVILVDFSMHRYRPIIMQPPIYNIFNQATSTDHFDHRIMGLPHLLSFLSCRLPYIPSIYGLSHPTTR